MLLIYDNVVNNLPQMYEYKSSLTAIEPKKGRN